ncbi:unannotated protein [freshwater metagenome]|uniref:Unannotated protein n=1 Tax=freshwater metagenome TaxID=449393 RepID=A0A6J7H8Q1_9ZZZZ|nr:hypothetical protein [Actinomycetota bacterium]
MPRSMLSVLVALALAAVTSTPAAAEPEVSASLVDLADSPKDFRLDKDLRKNKQAVSAGEASDISSATFAITGAGETAVLEARINVARLMGKKHAYNQAVGLYGYNFQYIVKSDGTASLNTYRKKHPTCAQASHQRNRAMDVVTITMPFPCLATGQKEQVIDARTWIHRRPRGVTVGGDTTQRAVVDILAAQFTGVKDPLGW